MCDQVDCTEVEEHLQSFEKIAKGYKDGGSIAALDLPSRLRWWTAARRAVSQTSKVHPGFCDDPEETLAKLFAQLVL